MVQNNENLEEGKRLTLYELMVTENWNIEIPIIQRDYVQGSSTAYEVRHTFVATLLEHLQSGKNVDLDFIYGSLKKAEKSIGFIPLDGQQRLTTLFLLHWYLAHKEDQRESFLNIFQRGTKSRFSYETRTSSTEFCDALMFNEFEFGKLVNSRISDTIKDASWFYMSWEDDPTIQSMLVMLDEMHEQFLGTNDLYEKLLQITDPVITFQFLNLDAFKLTDDLYIKMNARGKQLTPFENFKAKFEQYLKGLSFENAKQYFLDFDSAKKQVPVHEYFSFKIDTEWANLFWNYRNDKNLFDEQLMNLIKIMATNYVAAQNTVTPSLKILASKDSQTFKEYLTIGCLVPDFILNLIDTLDLLKNGNETIHKYLSDNSYIDEDNLFRKVITNNLTYIDRIRFFALYQYLLRNGNDEGLEDWVRIIFNLTENSIYNEIEEYATAISSVKRLLPNSKTILKYFSSDSDRIMGFLEYQVQEERIKACLLLKDKIWYAKITELESHGYFKGQISFLLNFSGIEAYYQKYNNCNWDTQRNQQYLDNLLSYNKKALSIFDKNGLILFPDFIIERALFSKGDYTFFSKSNQTFLVNQNRDISWKRLLRDDNNGKRAFVKSLFDDPTFNIENVENSLSSVITASTVVDWRKGFIELPGIISYLGTSKFFRKLWNANIQLLKGERISGPHVEYYSFAFYLKYLKNQEWNFSPFSSISYPDISGDYLPFIKLSYERRFLDIIIEKHANPEILEIRFQDEFGREINSKISTELTLQGFNKIERSIYGISVITEIEVLNVLNTLCSSFKTQNL